LSSQGDKETLGEDFFKLRTGVAGELLQKCSNFRIRLAIVGDFSEYTSKSLRDFIYESNKGNLVYFTNDLDSASEVLV
jgi:spore coat polysaccharide biosynthesis predicted glycosyltransferase SpsG